MHEAARAAAREIAAGRPRGPLHGIPIGLKDIYKTNGIRTTARSRRYEHHVPDRQGQGAGALRVRMQKPAPAKAVVSVATPATKPKGGRFVLHAKALHGNPFAGHTLGPVVAELEKLTGIETRRIHVDKGYRGYNHPQKFRVWITGQVRRVTAMTCI